MTVWPNTVTENTSPDPLALSAVVHTIVENEERAGLIVHGYEGLLP